MKKWLLSGAFLWTLLVWPFAGLCILWSINTLFALSVPYTLKNIVAILLLTSAIRGKNVIEIKNA